MNYNSGVATMASEAKGSGLAVTLKPGQDTILAALGELNITAALSKEDTAKPTTVLSGATASAPSIEAPSGGSLLNSPIQSGGLSGRRRAKNNLKLGSLPGSNVSSPSGSPVRPIKDLTLNRSETESVKKESPLRGKCSEGVLIVDKVGYDNDLELNPEDFVILEGDVGAGAGGVVKKVQHIPTGIVMAQKLMHVEPKPDKQRMLLRELQFTKQCQHQNIVEYFGAYHDKGEIYLCMEYMNCGALNDVLSKAGPLPEHVVAQIAVNVLNGLIYLKVHHRVMHRDVKPSNILINTDGAIKVCDFGVSGVLDLNSMAASFVGTQSYMAPERLEGKTYAAQSDVWSLGLTLLELVLGRYPFHPEELKTRTGALREPTLFELLNFIVTRPPPHVPSDRGFSEDFQDFIRMCLMKDEKMRPTPSSLRNHPWIQKAEERNFDMKEWMTTLNVDLKRPEL